jgi:AcrR family transcriptional regulator
VATAKFSADGILDATAQEVFRHGPNATIADIAGRLGAPTGSIYHRFPSREELFVRLWLRSVRRFHVAFLEAGDDTDAERALLGMAASVATFTRDHQADAAAMTLFRQSRLVESAPASCRGEVEQVNAEIHARLAVLAALRYGDPTPRQLAYVRIASSEGPYGLVRPYIWDGVPDWLTDVVVASSRAVLALGDESDPPGH